MYINMICVVFQRPFYPHWDSSRCHLWNSILDHHVRHKKNSKIVYPLSSYVFTIHPFLLWKHVTNDNSSINYTFQSKLQLLTSSPLKTTFFSVFLLLQNHLCIECNTWKKKYISEKKGRKKYTKKNC